MQQRQILALTVDPRWRVFGVHNNDGLALHTRCDTDGVISREEFCEPLSTFKSRHQNGEMSREGNQCIQVLEMKKKLKFSTY
jgi:hypothetical protein